VTFMAAARSDQGKVRGHNEDAWFADVERCIFIVADGLGGCAGGEVASKMVIDRLPVLFDAELGPQYPLHSLETVNSVEKAINKLNGIVREAGRKHLELSGMGSTLVLAMIRGERILIAHVGDSRAYLLHDGSFIRLTRDHSVIQDMLDDGLITPQEAAVHPSRAIVTQCIGTSGRVSPDISHIDFQSGDRLLLCSDGLTNMLSDQDIASILGQQTGLDTVSRDLIHAANDAGGEDNVTVVIVETVSPDHKRSSGKLIRHNHAKEVVSP